MSKYFWVVQNLELGWDNVVALIPVEEATEEQLQKIFPGKTYVFSCRRPEGLEYYD